MESSEKGFGPVLSKWEVALIGLSPLLIFFAADSTFNMQTLLPLTALLLVGFVLKARNAALDKRNLILSIALMASCAVSLLLCVIVSPVAVNGTSIIRLGYAAMIILYFFLVVSRNYRWDQIRWILNANVACGAFIALGVLLRSQSLGGQSGKIAVTNIWGVALETNYLGALLAFTLVLGVCLFRFARGAGKKCLLAAACCVIFAGIFFTGSRAALLGALLGLICLVVYYLLQRGQGSSVLGKLVLVVLVIAGIIVTLQLADLLPTWYLDRFFRNSYADESNTERLRIWAFGFQGFLGRPVMGYGIGNFNYYFRHGLGYSSTTVVAHNTYLDILIDIGLVGSAVFFALAFGRLRGFHRSGPILALVVVAFFTALIVGGERTFFFWNSIVILNLLSRYLKANKDDRDLRGLFGG